LDSIEWTTADPVTGTLGRFSYNTDGSGSSTEEYEPLGQTISTIDPAAAPEPEPPNEPSPIGDASEPQWQCEMGEAFYGGFSAMPFHCQKKMLMDLSSGLTDLYGFSTKEESPHRLADSPLPDFTAPYSASDEMMTYALTATDKEDEEASFQQDDKKPRGGQVTVRRKKKKRGKGGNKTPMSETNDALKRFAAENRLSDEECDNKMSRIFGGYAMAMDELGDINTPPTNPGVSRSRTPHSAQARNDLSATTRMLEYDEKTDKEKLVTRRRYQRGGIIHTYTDSSASVRTDTDLFTPAGWISSSAYYTGGNSGLIFNYAGGITIEFVHAGTTNANKVPSEPSNVANANGLTRIGYVGGAGGVGSPNYNHTHIVFFSNKTTNERIDPRFLFCGFPK